jgi:hypothetical protein
MKTNGNWNQNIASTHTLANACLTSCRKVIERLGQAKEMILREFRTSLPGHEQLVRLAVNEAEALAWETEFPHLVFPALAMEKAQSVALWQARQNALWHGPAHLALAA